MTSKLKTDVLETGSGSGTIALNNQLSGMTTASLPALTHAEMPVGSVLQVVQSYTPSTSASTTSTSPIGTGVTAVITPKFNNSLILVSYSGTMSYLTSGTGTFKMYMDNGGSGYAQMPGGSHYHVGYMEANNRYAPIVFNGNFVATSLNTLTFQLYVQSSGVLFTYFHSASSNALTLTEIKQ